MDQREHQQGCLRNSIESSPFNSNRPRPPKPIDLLRCTQRQTGDSRQSKRTSRKTSRRKRSRNGRKGEIMACVLRAPQQVTCSTDVRAAQQRPSAAPQHPSHLEKKHLPQTMHTLSCIACLFTPLGPAAMMFTLRDDSAAAQPERSAAGSAFWCEQPLSPRRTARRFVAKAW